MHVCHFSDTSLEGDYFRNITTGLVGKGVQISLIELGVGKEPSWLKGFPDVSYLSLSAGRKMQYPRAIFRLARFLKNENVAILHTHLFNSGLVGVLAGRFSQNTIVAMMRHHTSVVRMLGSRIHLAADKWMAENADRVLTVSHAARQYMIETDGIDRDDIEVVHLGFDFEKLAPNADDRLCVRSELGISDDELVIGYVANFVKGKGHLQILEAFAKISAEIPRARLLFVGSGSLPEVTSSAVRFGDRVIFAGWRSDVSACLNAMDLFIQPSLSEAFSQVLIEAMGVGLPVIATKVGGANEVIENGVNGILIKPDDSAAMSAAAIELLKDASKRKAMAKAGMTSVRARFTAERMVDRHFALYQRWVNER